MNYEYEDDRLYTFDEIPASRICQLVSCDCYNGELLVRVNIKSVDYPIMQHLQNRFVRESGVSDRYRLLKADAWKSIGKPTKKQITGPKGEILTVYGPQDADEVEVGAVGYFGDSIRELATFMNQSVVGKVALNENIYLYHKTEESTNYALFACESPKAPEVQEDKEISELEKLIKEHEQLIAEAKAEIEKRKVK